MKYKPYYIASIGTFVLVWLFQVLEIVYFATLESTFFVLLLHILHLFFYFPLFLCFLYFSQKWLWRQTIGGLSGASYLFPL